MQALAQQSWHDGKGTYQNPDGAAYTAWEVSCILNAMRVTDTPVTMAQLVGSAPLPAGVNVIRPGGIRRSRARVLHFDKTGAMIQDLTTSVQRVTLSFDNTASITRSVEVQFRHLPGPTTGQLGSFNWQGVPQRYINPYKDRAEVWVDIGAPDGGWLSWKVFTGVFTVPEETTTPSTRMATVQLHDYGQFLLDQKFQGPVSVNAADQPSNKSLVGSPGDQPPLVPWTSTSGQTGPNTVYGLLWAAGFDGSHLPAPDIPTVASAGYVGYDDTNHGEPITWNWGTSYLKAINDLLAAVHYHPLWFNESGVPTSRPIQPLFVQLNGGSARTWQEPPPVYGYTTDPTQSYESVLGTATALTVLPPVVDRVDASLLANVVQLSSSDPTSPVGYIARNFTPLLDWSTSKATDAASIATSNAGRDIFRLVEENNIASAEIALQRCLMETAYSASTFHTISLPVALMPALQAHDYLRFYVSDTLFGTAEVLAFTLELRVGSPNTIGTALSGGGVGNATNQSAGGATAALRHMALTLQFRESVVPPQNMSVLYTNLQDGTTVTTP